MKKRVIRVLSLMIFACLVFGLFPQHADAAGESWLWPVPDCTWLTSGRHWTGNGSSAHNGIDIPGGDGTPIYAARSGVVVVVYTGCNSYSTYGNPCQWKGSCNPNHGYDAAGYCNNSFGNGVIIEHTEPNGSKTYSHYAHMQANSVLAYEGMKVSRGQQIGSIGAAGQADGAHLHFSLANSTSALTTYNNNKDVIGYDFNGPYFAGLPSNRADLGAYFLANIVPTTSAHNLEANFSGSDPVLHPENGYNIRISEEDKVTSSQIFAFFRIDAYTYIIEDMTTGKQLACNGQSGPVLLAAQDVTNIHNLWYICQLSQAVEIAPVCNPGKRMQIGTGTITSAAELYVVDRNSSSSNDDFYLKKLNLHPPRRYVRDGSAWQIDIQMDDTSALGIAETRQLGVPSLPDYKGSVATTNLELVWSSLDPSVATVDENGVVTAVGEGTATIRANSVFNPWFEGTVEVVVETKCDHSWDKGTVAEESTCTEDGVKLFTCTKCQSVKKEAIPMLGHDYQEKVQVKLTCTQDGVSVFTCSRCGDSNTKTTPAVGQHTYKGVIATDSDGMKKAQLVCDRCEDTVDVGSEWIEMDTIPAELPTDVFEIEYPDIRTTVAVSSPGEGWVNIGEVSSHYENRGSVYDSDFELTTSATRVYVGSYYYHYCGSNGDNAEHYWTNTYYDYHNAGDINQFNVARSAPDDADSRYTWYEVTWKDGQWAGGKATCAAGRTAKYYRRYQYQDRVLVTEYNWEKDFGWTSTMPEGTTPAKVRIRANVVPDPKIYAFNVTSITPNGFKVKCKAADEKEIVKVAVEVWNEEDPANVVTFSPIPILSNGAYVSEATVRISMLGTVVDCPYHCTVKTYDAAEHVMEAKLTVLMPSLNRSNDRLLIPVSTKTIDDSAFAGDSKIGEVVLPDGLTTIGSKAFADCAKLVLVEVPDSVKDIADDAFADSSSVVLLCSADSSAAKFAAKNSVPYLTALE